MQALLGPDDELLRSNLALRQGTGSEVELSIRFGTTGRFFDGRGAFCTSLALEFPVEVVIRQADEVLFSVSGDLEITDPNFGHPTRLSIDEEAGLLDALGVDPLEVAPEDGQQRHAILDIYASEGEVQHVRLELGNYDESTGNGRPIAEVLFEDV